MPERSNRTGKKPIPTRRAISGISRQSLPHPFNRTGRRTTIPHSPLSKISPKISFRMPIMSTRTIISRTTIRTSWMALRQAPRRMSRRIGTSPIHRRTTTSRISLRSPLPKFKATGASPIVRRLTTLRTNLILPRWLPVVRMTTCPTSLRFRLRRFKATGIKQIPPPLTISRINRPTSFRTQIMSTRTIISRTMTRTSSMA